MEMKKSVILALLIVIIPGGIPVAMGYGIYRRFKI